MRPRRRGAVEQARHADDWLMTYADTITLLLCLFVVVLSVTATRKNPVQKFGFLPEVAQPVTPVAIAPDATPPDKTIPEATTPDTTIEAALPFHRFVRTDPTAEDAADDPPASQVDVSPAPRPATPGENVAVLVPVSVPAAAEPRFARPAERNDAHSPRLPEVVNRLTSQGQAVVTQEGDRITTLEIGSTAFFSSGSATLSKSGRAILRDVALTLQSDELNGYEITVEGHTDDTPISTPQFPSNWELSTARAAAVVHCLIEQGVAAQRLRAAGYADSFPVVPNRSPDGTAIPQNQARNRRVVIKLEKIDKGTGEGPMLPGFRAPAPRVPFPRAIDSAMNP